MSHSTKRTSALVGLTAVASIAAVAVPLVATGAGSRNDRSAEVARAIDDDTARSVILLIGDGMGDSEITIARNYALGAAGRLQLDRLPLTGAYTTYSVVRGTNQPDYVPDSAATGTAWATGTKTYDNGVSVNTNGRSVPTILELAKAGGYRTGSVTTSEVQDATPAVLTSHVTTRSCYGPVATSTACPANAVENGGAGSISEQTADSGADLVLGGGSAAFQEVVKAGRFAGLTVEQQARVQGFTVVKDAAALAALPKNKSTRALGLFATGNLATEFAPLLAVNGGTGAPQRCRPNPTRPSTEPTVDVMAKTAIDVLDRKSRGDRKGFFLQIEGASIDKRDHAADLCGQIGENIAFDRAVGEALRYQRQHPDTLVITSGDHAHTSQVVDSASTPGGTATVLTGEGSPMIVNYGTSALTGSQQHTGSQIRVAAGGPQAANVVGVTDQTDLFFTMRRALGLG